MRKSHPKGFGRRLSTFASTCFVLGTLCAPVHAAVRAPARVGGQVAGGWARVGEARLAAQLDVGLTQSLSLRLLAGPTLHGHKLGGTLATGPLLSLDALSWVPKLGALVGVSLPEACITAQAGGELTRYLSAHTGAFVSLWATWHGKRGFGGLLTLGFEHELF